jgi:hypothetical protein
MMDMRGGNVHGMRVAREAKRKIVLQSVYCERGESFMPGDICKLLNIEIHAASYLLSAMAKDGLIEMLQRRNNRGLLVNTFRARKPSILHKPWRKHSNAFTGMQPYHMLGAPI